MRKKLSKIGKSLLSFVLCLTILLTTFCFFDIGSLISEASVGIKSFSSGVDPAVTFYVPETIYLAPTSGTMNTFQYYVDRANAVNGALRTGENTTGNVLIRRQVLRASPVRAQPYLSVQHHQAQIHFPPQSTQAQSPQLCRKTVLLP